MRMVGNFSLSSSKFRRKLGRLEVEDREIGEEWREMEGKINRVLREMEGGGKSKGGEEEEMG